MQLEEEEIQKQREDVKDAKWNHHQWILSDAPVEMLL